MKPTDFSVCVSGFFIDFLAGQRNLSSNTIKSYRDTMALLLVFFSEKHNIPPEKLTLAKIDNDKVTEYLLWLEKERLNSISTRNQRLAAIHAFFRYVQYQKPELLLHCQRIIAVPFKRHQKTVVNYLSEETLKSILSQPNLSTADGLRDAAILSLLYDSGARVQELIDLRVRDIRLDAPATVTLNGKGRKSRVVPLMKQTVDLMNNYMLQYSCFDKQSYDKPLFCNRQHKKLTRSGITYILGKYVILAGNDTTLPDSPISPHVLRHTKAMHMLKANVNLYYIRDFLGHVDISTTEVYARADAEMKRAALEKVNADVIPTGSTSWQSDKDLLSWLKDLGKDN